MKRTTFASAQDVEQAFYEALERADLDTMMEVWADDEEVVCIHPSGPRLAGYERVRENWAQIFASPQRLQVRTSDLSVVQGMMFAIHNLLENITVVGEPRAPPVAVTNVYVRTSSGWRMLVHHASHAPGAPPEPAAEGPKILH